MAKYLAEVVFSHREVYEFEAADEEGVRHALYGLEFFRKANAKPPAPPFVYLGAKTGINTNLVAEVTNG